MYTKFFYTLYRADSWTLSKATENKLQIFERKVLRKIYGPTQEADIWRVKYNSELYDLYNEPEIIKIVKAERMGHLCRMEEGNICKQVTFYKMIDTRKRGRPALRWIDGVHKDLQRTGVKKWRMAAMNRSMWNQSIFLMYPADADNIKSTIIISILVLHEK